MAAMLERVDERLVFARDRWRCQICGGKVPRRKAVPHPKAATLDHVVPLAEGGAHVTSNVQLAHFICNSYKGNGAVYHARSLAVYLRAEYERHVVTQSRAPGLFDA